MPTGAVTHYHQQAHHPTSQAHPKLWLAAIITALIVCICGCSDPQGGSANTRISLDKQSVMTVKMSKYQPSFAFDGTIIPAKSAVMDLIDAAQVNEVFVQAGDEVTAGDVLLSYTPDMLTDNAANQSDELHLTAEFDGTITQLHAVSGTHYPKKTPLVEIQDLNALKFISRLSATLMDYIKVGDAVTFGVDGVTHTGQISQVVSASNDNRLIDVHVMIPLEPAQDPNDLLGRSVVGHIDYGQIQVGVMMPKMAVYDAQMNAIDLEPFAKPPHKPESPIDGQIWVIKQNHRLALSPVKLLEYYPKNQQFLVQGITEDSLVVTQPLPKEARDQEVHLK
ncbi:efflux RND transporter periplasmic adaptor subunit [Moraxella porci]|nr:HlyD family efflux transporter periplasmic adaptor subunit [Moraxella porci]